MSDNGWEDFAESTGKEDWPSFDPDRRGKTLDGGQVGHALRGLPWDGGASLMCAVGLSQTQCAGCAGCSGGICRPRSALDVPNYPCLPDVVTSLWSVRATEIVPDAGADSSIGGCFAAAHVGAHSCLAVTFSILTGGIALPHHVHSATDAIDYARNLGVDVATDKGHMVALAKLVFGDGDHGDHISWHVLALPATAPANRTKIVSGAYTLYVSVMTVQQFVTRSKTGVGVTVDRGVLADTMCKFCAEGSKQYCNKCKGFVAYVGHSSRCMAMVKPGQAAKLIHARAILGDAVHRLDVVRVALHMKMSDKERGPWVARVVSHENQARYMRKLTGMSGSDNTMATMFKALYDQLRVGYLATEYGEHHSTYILRNFELDFPWMMPDAGMEGGVYGYALKHLQERDEVPQALSEGVVSDVSDDHGHSSGTESGFEDFDEDFSDKVVVKTPTSEAGAAVGTAGEVVRSSVDPRYPRVMDESGKRGFHYLHWQMDEMNVPFRLCMVPDCRFAKTKNKFHMDHTITKHYVKYHKGIKAILMPATE